MEAESLNRILQEDMEAVVNSNCPLSLLENATVLITGASGLLGSQIVKTLACANRLKGLNIRILALIRNEKKAIQVFGDLLKREDIHLVCCDINQIPDIEDSVEYIIHAASPTSSRYFVTNPVETILTAVEGTRNILELGRRKNVKGFVYLSSLEVYGVPNTKDGHVTEKDYGYIEPLNIRSSYSEGKRLVECLCASFAEEYGVPVKIARLSQTFGAGVEYDDSRVFAEFARCVMEKQNIVLHTEGKTLRTYCYTKDAVSAILFILLKGKAGEAYNVTNSDTAVTISEMAQCVCDLFPEKNICVQYDIPDNLTSFGYNPEMVIRMDCTKLESLGWKATVDLKGMFFRMIEYFEKALE